MTPEPRYQAVTYASMQLSENGGGILRDVPIILPA
jgi:hypothetical protein